MRYCSQFSSYFAGLPDLVAPGVSVRQEGRRALVTLAGTLGTFGSGLSLRSLSHQSLTIVILGVVLSLSLSRLPKHRGRQSKAMAVLVVPLVALSASSIGHLLLTRANLGATAFIAAMVGAMWLRQFGPTVARIARLLTLPITSILVVPGVGYSTGSSDHWWQMLIALVALAWVYGTQSIAARLHLLPPDPPARPSTTAEGPASWRRLTGHTRMALQLAAALIAAFVVGRTVFPGHWNWTVLTATIVCGGGPSRGEVLSKGVARLIGASMGTAVATGLASAFPGHDSVAVVLIFVLLFVGSWWREVHYAVWAGCVTCVMALLNDYFGAVDTTSLLGSRLEAILAGAACAIAASALILPVHTVSMARKRRGTALVALADVVDTLGDHSGVGVECLRVFDARVRELSRTARPLRVQQSLLGWIAPVDPLLLSSIRGIAACRAPLRAAVLSIGADHAKSEGLQPDCAALRRLIAQTRQFVAGRREELPTPVDLHDGRLGELSRALLAVSAPPVTTAPTFVVLDGRPAQ